MDWITRSYPAFIIAIFGMSGCASNDRGPNGVSEADLISELSRSSQDVQTIDEGRESFGFFNADSSGPFTRDMSVILDSMLKVLGQCEADVVCVARILEG